MDTYCLFCGEPWELFYVSTEVAECDAEFDFGVSRAVIHRCPCCDERGPPPQHRTRWHQAGDG